MDTNNAQSRYFLDTTERPSLDPPSTSWTVERDACGNAIFRPPSSQLTTQMCLNTEEHFGQPRLTAETTIKNELLEVQGYTFELEAARKWARNLRFLVCVRLTEMPSLENREYQDFPMPHRQAVRQIWLTEAGEVLDAKYLAISYCWKSSRDPRRVEDKAQYVVLDRGRPRPNKAPVEILDRAIHLAAYHSIKYIWIDQECIDQDDRNDQELGIQSMDLVFERAFITAGLLSSAIETLEHGQALGSLRRAIRLNAYGDVIPDYAKCEELFENHVAILEAMEILASDKWLTRSWILQEASSAGNRLVLLAKWIQGEAYHGQQEPLKGEIYIDFVHLHALLEIISHTFLAPPGSSKLLALRNQLPPEFLARMEWACNRLQFLSPQVETFAPRDQSLLDHGQDPITRQSMGIEQDLHRPTCNAAEALVFMSVRKNSRVEDRLAIVANLCKYPLRMNTTKVQHTRFGLSVCLFALALINGDLSLMAGISAEEWLASEELRLYLSRNSFSFSWLPPPTVILSKLRVCYESANTCRLVDHRITPSGLLLSGYLWTIDQKVCFLDIQREYGPFKQRTQVENIEIYWRIFQTLFQRGEYGLAEAIWQSVNAEFVNVDYTRYPTLKRSDFPVPSRFCDVVHRDSGVFLTHLPPLVTGEKDRHRLFDFNHLQRVSRGDLFRGFRQNREWVTRKVLNDGFLWCGKLADSGNELCALFDVDEPLVVLTPHSKGLVGFPRDKIRLEQISWVVMPKTDSWKTLIATRMVRGAWSLEGLSPSQFTLA